MEQKLPKKIQWVKSAFHREILLKDQDHVVGKLARKTLSSDVVAELGNVHLLFDVRGFLKKRVEVKDLQRENTIVATITFSWGHTATLQLNSGQQYVWERKNLWMKEWGMIRDLPGDENDVEVIHYTRLRQLLADEGEIELRQVSTETALILLAGLFVRNYFLRRKRIAAS